MVYSFLLSFYFLLYNNFSVLSIYSYTYCVFLFVSVRPRVEGGPAAGCWTRDYKEMSTRIKNKIFNIATRICYQNCR